MKFNSSSVNASSYSKLMSTSSSLSFLKYRFSSLVITILVRYFTIGASIGILTFNGFKRLFRVLIPVTGLRLIKCAMCNSVCGPK